MTDSKLPATGHEDKTDVELVAYCHDVLKVMKANGYFGLVWDELLRRFARSEKPATPPNGYAMVRGYLDAAYLTSKPAAEILDGLEKLIASDRQGESNG